MVEIEVPHSNISPEFLLCMKDTTTSYRKKSPADVAPGGASDLVMRVVDNELRDAERLFVTGDDLKGVALPTPEPRWASAIAAMWRTSEEELIQSAKEIEVLWDSPVHSAFLSAFNELSRPAKVAAATPLAIKSDDVRDYLRMNRSAAAKESWASYAAYSAAQLKVLLSVDERSLSAEQRAAHTLLIRAVAQRLSASAYVSTYLREYFRNGAFVTLNWNLGNPLSDLKALAGKSSDIDKAKIQKILDDITRLNPRAAADLDDIINKTLSGTIGKVAQGGLVTRGGDSLAMPVVTVMADVTKPKPLSITKVDANAVLEDVIRVTFEGIFDSINLVPAVSNATGLTLPAGYEAMPLPDFATVVTSYPRGGATMDPDSFAKVDAMGGKAQAMTASAMASIIRGANIAALNNEALANTLTTAAATTARKVAERVTWCYYAVIGPQAPGPASSNLGPRSSKAISFSLEH